MKFYKCDECGNEFSPKDGMVNGQYTYEISVQWKNSNGKNDTIKVKKTMKLYKNVPPTTMIPGHEVKISLDLCCPCIMKFEGP